MDTVQPPAKAVLAGTAKPVVNIPLLASAAMLVALVAAPFLFKNFIVFQLTMILSYAIAILSLNILTGAGGQFSLGHSAFYAVGAYGSAIIMEVAHLPYGLAIPLSGLLCFVVGVLFGLPALRLRGVYLALATFSLAVAAPALIKLRFFEHLTGGVMGLVITKPDVPFGLKILNQDGWIYYLALFVALLTYILSRNLLGSRTGRAFMAIRDNDIAAVSMGINLSLYKTLGFGISAGLTGVAGSLGAISVAFVSPDSYTVNFAIALFLGMVIGGVGWLPGSLAGAAFIVLVPNVAEEVSKGLSGAVFGAIVIAVIFLLPDGAKQLAFRARDLVEKLLGRS